jgi:hypothetical protein
MVYPTRLLPGTNEEGNAMRLTLIIAVALILTPAALTARPADAPELTAHAVSTDISAAKKKKAKAKVKTEEKVKAAPGTSPADNKPSY